MAIHWNETFRSKAILLCYDVIVLIIIIVTIIMDIIIIISSSFNDYQRMVIVFSKWYATALTTVIP